MSSRSLSDIQTLAEGESLYIRFKIGCECFNVLKKSDLQTLDLQTLIKHSFLFNFPHELLQNEYFKHDY